MTRKLGVGMIGLGLAVKPHALALRDLADRVQFIGGYSPSAERRAAFAGTYGMPTVDSLEALLGNPEIDAVWVLTPPNTHADIALRAARSGKHVLLEKPVDVDLPRSRALVEGVERAGRTLGVVFQSRFRPGPVALRDLLRAGALGELISASASIRWWRSAEYYAQAGRGTRARDGGGVLLTQAIHTLDLLLDLVGPATTVMGQTRASGLRSVDTEDVACAAVTYGNGAVGVIDASTAVYPGYPERIDIAGTGGSAVIEAEKLIVQRPGHPALEIAGSSAGGGGADPMAFSHEPHKLLIADFLDAIATGRAPQSSGRSALAVQALIDAILASSATGAPVPVAATVARGR